MYSPYYHNAIFFSVFQRTIDKAAQTETNAQTKTNVLTTTIIYHTNETLLLNVSREKNGFYACIHSFAPRHGMHAMAIVGLWQCDSMDSVVGEFDLEKVGFQEAMKRCMCGVL